MSAGAANKAGAGVTIPSPARAVTICASGGRSAAAERARAAGMACADGARSVPCVGVARPIGAVSSGVLETGLRLLYCSRAGDSLVVVTVAFDELVVVVPLGPLLDVPVSVLAGVVAVDGDDVSGAVEPVTSVVVADSCDVRYGFTRCDDRDVDLDLVKTGIFALLWRCIPRGNPARRTKMCGMHLLLDCPDLLLWERRMFSRFLQ